MNSYSDFLARKRISDPMTGMADVGELPAFMFPHQRDIVSWSLRRGRSAIFAGTGLGKTAMELVWADKVASHTGKPVLIFAPLAVSQQHIREAGKFGLSARIVADQSQVSDGVNVTNYQKIGKFDLSAYGGICLDESSILKSTDGHYRTRLIEECASIPFRLAATATPAPNDFMELGNHAEFLGVMSYTDMLATFFVHDGGDTQKWRLKGHAESEFWKWMASWAVMLRKPSDLGYPNDGYDLPPLVQNQHVVGVDYAPSLDTGLLFPMEARSMSERIAARRDTVAERVEMAASIVTGKIWNKLTADKSGEGDSECGSQNTRPTDAQKLTAILSMLQNSKQHEAERQKKIENTCAPTTRPTSTNGVSGRPSNESATTPNGGSNTPPTKSLESASRRTPANGRQISGERNCFETNTALRQPSTTNCCAAKMEFVQSATEDSGAGCMSITATTLGQSEVSFAAHATPGSDSSRTIPAASTELLSISGKLEPWVVWCHLNKEQDALEKAFGALAISIHGSLTDDQQMARHEAWLRGDAPVLICKPSMFGHGLNWQHCCQCIFVGLNDSFEQVFQAVRRFWRFGQTKPVTVHFIAAETEGAVVANIKRKEADAERMAAAMVRHTSSISSELIRGLQRDRPDYDPQVPLEIPGFLEVAA
jgi:hypothetical protein